MLDPLTVSAIVTAAGRSARMGRPKALLPWGGRTLIEHQCAALGGLAEVVVVVGSGAAALRSEVPR